MFLVKKFAYALACAAVLFAACSDDDKPVLPEEEVSEKTVEAIVVNEGQWTKNLGSISAIYSDGTVDADIFRQVNNRPLGDVAQDIALINGAYFVPINNSHIIQVVDAKTFESKATILAPDITPDTHRGDFGHGSSGECRIRERIRTHQYGRALWRGYSRRRT